LTIFEVIICGYGTSATGLQTFGEVVDAWTATKGLFVGDSCPSPEELWMVQLDIFELRSKAGFAIDKTKV